MKKEDLLSQVINLQCSLKADNAPQSEIEAQILYTVELCAKYLSQKFY